MPGEFPLYTRQDLCGRIRTDFKVGGPSAKGSSRCLQYFASGTRVVLGWVSPLRLFGQRNTKLLLYSTYWPTNRTYWTTVITAHIRGDAINRTFRWRALTRWRATNLNYILYNSIRRSLLNDGFAIRFHGSVGLGVSCYGAISHRMERFSWLSNLGETSLFINEKHSSTLCSIDIPVNWGTHQVYFVWHMRMEDIRRQCNNTYQCS